MTTSQDAADRLRTAGLRLTPQRLAIYQALLDHRDHPTAQTLYAELSTELPSLSQATVYNTLQALAAHGLIHELGDAGDGAVHYDADVSPHLNLVCTSCQRIDDFRTPAMDAAATAVTTASGYQIYGARLVYYGLCPACQEEPNHEG